MIRILWLALFASQIAAAIEVVDDDGNRVVLASRAKRIVSLAPNITELLFAAGAGDRVVGVVAYSDFPAAAARLPKVGSFDALDLEAIMALRPDLVIAWMSGNSAAQIEKLRQLKIPIYRSEPKRLQDIPGEIERFGVLAASERIARGAALDFRARQSALSERYSRAPRASVFFEIWNRPLMTIGHNQIIDDAISLCGGNNIFGQLQALAPTVSVEAVLAANPEVIVASGMGNDRPKWLDDWRRWGNLTAVARDNLYFVPADLINRQSPRILEGVEMLCGQIDSARAKRIHPVSPR